jgi:hypothetical protein
VSADGVEERRVLPWWQVHVGHDYSWQVMWSHVADQLSVPRNLKLGNYTSDFLDKLIQYYEDLGKMTKCWDFSTNLHKIMSLQV